MAAGLGYIEFTTGDILTAATANGYLASQTVMVFADAAARTAAITSPQEGMITYLKDTNAVEKYTGSAYVSVGGSSPLTTKGDVYTFSTVDARLAVGANGTVLTADSAEATGLKWVAPSSGGAMTFLATSTFTSASSVSINDVFSATYDNYLIMGTVTATDNGDVNFRFRVGGADNSTSNYNFQVIDIDGTGVAASRGSSLTFGRFVATKTGGERSSFSSTVMSPFLGITKHYVGLGVLRTNSTTFANNISGGFNTTTSFTGLTLLASSGTISGTVRVYGIKNA